MNIDLASWDLLIVLGASVLSAVAGWPLTSLILHLAASRTERRLPPLSPRADDPQVPASRETAPIDTPGLLRGGRWIGMLERLLITGGTALGQPAIVAVVIAVKGLGRFPELRESRAAGERFIIGTFVSTAVAGLLGAVAAGLIGLV